MALRQNNLKMSDSRVSEEVTHVSTAYHELLLRANTLADQFSKVGNKYKDHNDAVERAKKWLKETEPKVAKICNEPIGAEPKAVEDQLLKKLKTRLFICFYNLVKVDFFLEIQYHVIIVLIEAF